MGASSSSTSTGCRASPCTACCRAKGEEGAEAVCGQSLLYDSEGASIKVIYDDEHPSASSWAASAELLSQVQNRCPELCEEFDFDALQGQDDHDDAKSVASGCSVYEDFQLSSITRPRKKKLSRQASGHVGVSNFLKQYSGLHDFQTGVPDFVLKAYDQAEHEIYQTLEALGDELQPFTPHCFGQVCADGKQFLKLSNLLKSFQRGPHVMDCKLGVRSFTEKEVHNTALRKDLYTRLFELDPSYPSQDEHLAQACSKYRWMTFNDEFTTLKSLGFRIDGIANSSQGKVEKKALQQACSLPDIAQVIIENFLPCVGTQEKDMHLDVVASIVQQLEELLEVLRHSSFAASHSIVGASLLFVVDAHASHARVFLIDLAKVSALPGGLRITHESPWVPGNHEDGVFLGFRSMKQCWDEVGKQLAQAVS
eukprot:TRINITY_DN49997_c0_g1_i1.p1 TRINITY_DN49997_c0_g1~~TRINITY_DN49997_c0_g1_i1.p1  ORF type:complete len:424 (+),score=105.07 TRINITY_DN49997_c0_g1_i1:125-1396(+)